MIALNQQMPESARAHMEAQFNLLSEMSKQLFGSMQRLNELNIQVVQTILQESFESTREVISAQDPYEALSIAAAQAQPAAEKLRAYQQHLTDIAARTQVDLSKAAERHVPETSRTAAAVVDEVARIGSEAAQQATQRQRAALDKLSTPLGKSVPGKSGTTANVH
ncbi:phasin family protein [Noviherbaspirillum humi]|uniref:Phasin family protein n=1 Tax=Noviherbaspirillum humi TaxID=1688639 RepID=A0A239HEI5_9BURK|nr:phasin family protein [Noviherbaspirillum humi]SNS79760.1 phasin family protein [Noviherbaspirillum humi]